MGNLASMQTKPFQAIGHASRMAAEIKTNLPFEPGGASEARVLFSAGGQLLFTGGQIVLHIVKPRRENSFSQFARCP